MKQFLREIRIINADEHGVLLWAWVMGIFE
jgi:hypothetical protein